MVEHLYGLLSAARFLTILPVPGPETAASRARSYLWFPLVGAAIGALAGVAYLAGHAVAPALGAVAATVALAAVTGALHLDGLADCADSLGAMDRQRRLAIMRDSRLGTYGAVALIGLLLAKTAVLWQAPLADAVRWLVASAGLARVAPLALAASLRYARREGIGVIFVDAVTPGLVVAAGVPAVALAAVVVGPLATLVALAAGAVVVGLTRQWARSALGGVTGDVMGASVELTEVSLLCVCAIWAWR